MGSATVTENLGDGKYKVKLDKATDKINADIQKKQTAMNNIVNTLIPAAQSAYDDAVIKYNTEKETFVQLVSELQSAQKTGTEEQIKIKMAEVRTQTPIIINAASDRDVSLKKFQTLNLQKLSLDKEIEVLQGLITEAEKDIREVWAVDYTPNIAVGTRVGTVEINGEAPKRPVNPATGLPDTTVPEKVQIVAGGSDGKGILTPKRVMTEKEWYTSETFKPGWQKWKPSFRIAEITSIDYVHNQCNVTLADAKSTTIKDKAVYDEFGQVVTPAQGFNINQTETLESVPFDYMTCNSTAFTVGDQVVIEFIDQVWTNPVVKGFVEAPRACHMQVKIRFKKAEAKQGFIDFCTARQTEWETFSNLLADFYSPADGGSGLLVDLMQWHQDNVGNIRSVSYGVQGE